MAKGYSVNAAPKIDFKSLATTAKDVAVRAVTTGEVFIEKDLYKTRKNICASCPELIGTRCKICGCFINVKLSLVAAKCPLKKW